jgi:response regulator RpfG family c-di-GMP phosphodiesterase
MPLLLISLYCCLKFGGHLSALADVFDALRSDRCYKKAWDDDKIFSLFKEERGKHFDPHLIDIFFEHLDTFLRIRDTFKDIVE